MESCIQNILNALPIGGGILNFREGQFPQLIFGEGYFRLLEELPYQTQKQSKAGYAAPKAMETQVKGSYGQSRFPLTPQNPAFPCAYLPKTCPKQPVSMPDNPGSLLLPFFAEVRPGRF
ncbi:MAG: hypothetical protein COX52_11850 [Syntrophobacterales bacterium CG23_combo_of_CG06-09_8_20_14_all_48_27]|nr:MAG: hypothetical protein COX52_11850 [Syntrophobacterales bacterium CG23_combo_of_CG06-09_8_20_14_all_48_27]PIY24672.1 MAG: hypothetical protein COZ11_07020 [Deltaproteobacteria bacterium CG_4_10_14_3_um_filter_51_14]